VDVALLSFDGVNSAVEAFSAERDRPGGAAPWTSEVGFVEHHENGKLVLRGTFAGHYVDADEALHTSGRGTAEGAVTLGVIGTLLAGPLGLAVGTVIGGTIGSQVGKPDVTDPEPEPLAERLRAAVPSPGSGIMLIAESNDVDELVAALGAASKDVARSALSAEDAATLKASLSASPAASTGPSEEGEEAVEASDSGG
jgi:uncharacterized membrane protein